MDLYQPRVTTEGGLGTDIGDGRYRVGPHHRLCNIYPIARHRFILRGEEIGRGKPKLSSPSDSAPNPSLDRIRSAKQSACLGHPSRLQILADPGSTDDYTVFHDRA